MAGPWNDDTITQLIALWRDGYSAGYIARAMGLSRNAVIGKMHRMDLTGARKAPTSPGRSIPQRRGAQANRPRKAQAKIEPKSLTGHRPNVVKGEQGARKSTKRQPLAERVQARLEAAQAANSGARRVSILELGPGQCRFAVEDGKHGDHRFCGAAAKEGSSYCAAHHAVCVDAERTEQAAARGKGFENFAASLGRAPAPKPDRVAPLTEAA